MTPNGGRADAVGVVGGSIVAVGDLRGVTSAMPAMCDVVDLGGGVAFPGFTDSHVHFLNLGRSKMGVSCWPSEVLSLQDIIDKVRDAATKVPESKWIRGRGFDPSRLPERRSPVASELDVASRHPVVLDSFDFHRRVVNHAALDAAGITRDTPDPKGGGIVRGHDGEPTGELFDAARALIDAVMPPWTADEDDEAVERASRTMLTAGFTYVVNAAPLGMASLGEEVRALGRAVADGSLPIRVTTMIGVGLLDAVAELGIRGGLGDAGLRLDGIKIFADGAFGPRTACMVDPYEHSDKYGHMSLGKDELLHHVRRSIDSGWRVCVHAIGDAAVGTTARLLATEGCGDGRLPHRIEHCCLTDDDAIRQMVAAGIVPVPQLPFLRERSRDFARAIGPERASRLFPLRSWIDAGLRPLHSTDAPVVEDVRPMVAVATGMSRCDMHGDVWGRDEAITLDEGIRMLTEWPAAAMGDASRRGRLAPGYLADLTVLDGDPYAHDDVDALAAIEARAVVVGGEIAWAD